MRSIHWMNNEDSEEELIIGEKTKRQDYLRSQLERNMNERNKTVNDNVVIFIESIYLIYFFISNRMNQIGHMEPN